jgi:hypothetical protein
MKERHLHWNGVPNKICSVRSSSFGLECDLAIPDEVHGVLLNGDSEATMESEIED